MYKKKRKKTGPLQSRQKKSPTQYILQVQTTILAYMSIDPKFVELTANVVRIFL